MIIGSIYHEKVMILNVYLPITELQCTLKKFDRTDETKTQVNLKFKHSFHSN